MRGPCAARSTGRSAKPVIRSAAMNPQLPLRPVSESQARLLALARHLAPRFAARAARHDRDATLPRENLGELREAGYLSAAVPVEYGGWGHGLFDVTAAQLELARGDGSTALAVGMHLMTCGTEASARSWPEEARRRILGAVAEEGALINNIAAEPELGSPRGGGRPRTALRPEGPGRWRLSGHKTFSTLAPELSYLITYVAVEDGTGDTGRVAVRGDLPGVRVEETWDALGMRATASHDVHFDGVPLEDADLLTRRPPGEPDPAMMQGGWFPLTVAASYLGVAFSARDEAVRFARERRPSGYAAPISQIPHVREQVGRMDAALLAARTFLLATAEEWEVRPEGRLALAPQVAAAKRFATNGAVEVVDLAMRVAGGVALLRGHPLERHYRDVRGGLVNPPIEARALEILARAALDEPGAAGSRWD